MGFDQYHEPAGELSAETRTFARMIASLTEEAEAIGWYEQRMSVEPDKQARAIMENAQQEEFKHFAMDLVLTRRTEKWQIALKTTMFTDGDIVEARGSRRSPSGATRRTGPRRGPFAWGDGYGRRGDSASFVMDESGQEVEPLDCVPD